MLRSHIGNVILSRVQIAARVAELAQQLSRDFAPPRISATAPLTVVPVMTGAMLFCADLVRQMPLRLRVATVRVSSYPGDAVRSRGAKIIDLNLGSLENHHVLLIDDILDSGNTLRLLTAELAAYRPATVTTCVLLRKDRPEARATPVDYVGFDIPDVFVVGYGLNYDDYYRNVPDIVSLKADILNGRP